MMVSRQNESINYSQEGEREAKQSPIKWFEEPGPERNLRDGDCDDGQCPGRRPRKMSGGWYG